VIAALLFTSCTLSPVVELFNATSRDASVLVSGEYFVIEPNTAVRFNYPNNDLGVILVCIGGVERDYELPSAVSPDYYEAVLFRRKLRVRMNVDGTLLVLPRRAGYTGSEASDQPVEPIALIGTVTGSC
jgi:hypothetical protein